MVILAISTFKNVVLCVAVEKWKRREIQIVINLFYLLLKSVKGLFFLIFFIIFNFLLDGTSINSFFLWGGNFSWDRIFHRLAIFSYFIFYIEGSQTLKNIL